MKMTKADLDWNEWTEEAGAGPEEMVLMKIVFHLHNQRPAGTTVKQIKITSHTQSHQARYLIALKLKTIRSSPRLTGSMACPCEAS